MIFTLYMGPLKANFTDGVIHTYAGCNLAREYMLASIVGLIGELGS